MLDNLNKYNIILASASPRRRELLSGLGVSFETLCLPGIDESFPDSLPANEVAEYISVKKAEAYKQQMQTNQLIITADTVVVSENRILGKPHSRENAVEMLRFLSGKTHHVITGVTILTTDKQKTFSVSTDVTFADITDEEIYYYIDRYQPMDKAGAYGIQEWIGFIAVESISGSYFNVMGLPIQRLYQELKCW
jgi:septum formation protein